MTISESKTVHAHSFAEPAVSTLLDQLNDTTSLWYHLRLAEMAGYDYIFAPEQACKHLHSLAALEAFVLNVQTILGTQGPRTILVSYRKGLGPKHHFEKYQLVWAEGISIDWRREALDNTPQQDFVQLLFEHSEPFILEAEQA